MRGDAGKVGRRIMRTTPKAPRTPATAPHSLYTTSQKEWESLFGGSARTLNPVPQLFA